MSHPITVGVHPSLVLAYRQATYAVRPPDQPKMELRINSVSSALATMMAAKKTTTAALLTAFNPRSKITSDQQNQQAQIELEEQLKVMGASAIPGEGGDPNGKWPSEPSVLALGISIAQAHELASQFEQNGFVWIGSSEAFCTLRLNYPLMVPVESELANWRSTLTQQLSSTASLLSAQEQATLMTVPPGELAHWLCPNARDLGQTWPLTRPDGSTMGAGSEYDRLFRLISAGLSPTFSQYVAAP